MNDARRSDEEARRLERLARRARAAIAWERIWPSLAALATISAFFVAVSWLGLWQASPLWLRIGGVVAFGLSMLASLIPLAGWRRPSRNEELARLDRDSGLLHRPAASLDDRQANAGHDPATDALWAAHRRKLAQAVKALKVRWPSPRLVERDRYALRAAALVALVASGFVAGPEKYERVLMAFDWRSNAAVAGGFRLDAWIDPPAYTGRPPLLLTGPGVDRIDTSTQGAPRPIRAPVGSAVIVRSTALDSLSIKAEGGLKAGAPAKKSLAPASRPAAQRSRGSIQSDSAERRWTLQNDGRLVLRRYGSTLLSVRITAIPDKPPVIALTRAPTSNARGSLTLSYKIDDDYGVVGAEARFAHPILDGKPLAGRTLVGPPKIALALPLGARGLGQAQTTADLSRHPWAGATVTMTLSATDEAGNVGVSDPVQITLPQRFFTKPLARALVEQRRNLTLRPDDRGRVAVAIDALMIAPEFFHLSPSIYLGLATISHQLADARTDSALLSVAALMWEMAVRIEDGDLTQAERELRDAQQKLRDALQHGASDQEIRKLTDQLRANLNKFLHALAQQQARKGGTQQAETDQRVITPRDLQSMLDRLENLARTGDRADAQRMLDQLQNLVENLQTGQSRRNPMAQALNRALNQLDQMTREQQQLRDRTFQQGRRSQEGRSDRGNENADAGDTPGSLRRQQRDLRRRLDELERKIQQFGMDPKKGLGMAEKAMRQAEQSLEKGAQGSASAVRAQGRALEALRKGARSLGEQMRQSGMGGGRMVGQGESGDRSMREGRNGSNSDPLGRESRDPRFDPFSRYNPLGAPAAQRAQQVLEELRRKLANPNRPQDELDYFERLLRPD